MNTTIFDQAIQFMHKDSKCLFLYQYITKHIN